MRLSHNTQLFSLRTVAYLFTLTLVVGTTGYMLIEGYTLGEALYMAVITISTVGFSEVRPLSTGGRIFTSGFVIVNLGITALFLSQLTQHLLEGGLLSSLRQRLMDKEIKTLRGHVIVCGGGRYGREIIDQLADSDEEVLLIERDRQDIEELLDRFPDLLFVEGDATADTVLEEAQVARAKSIIVVLGDDSANAFCVLSARELAPKLTIIARITVAENRSKLLRIGADYVVQPEQIGSFFMATLVRKPSAVEFFTSLASGPDAAAGFEEVTQDRLPDELRGLSIRDMDLRRRTGVSVVALRYEDGHYEVNPNPTRVLLTKTSLIALGDGEQLGRLRELLLDGDDEVKKD